MRGWSFPLGRWFGVDVRIHTFFLMLLAVAMASASVLDASGWRGILLWLLLLFAVAAREAARAMVATFYGLEIRTILLLPIGGLFSWANPDSVERSAKPRIETALAVVGPLVSLALAGLIYALILGATPQVDTLSRPWITPLRLMRSAMWINVAVAVINFLPAYPLDAGRLLRGSFARSRGTAEAARASAGLSRIMAMGALISGLALLALPTGNTASGLGAALSPWLIVGAFFVFTGAQLEDQGTVFQSVVDTVHMRDVMLTDFSTLSPSDTLEDALSKAIHSLQDDFPVVRGPSIVGVISKQTILEALRAEGNGYVQGVMVRAFQVAAPEDSLGSVIRRTAGGRMSMVPVADADNGRVVGVVSLQNLMHSMGLLSEHRKLRARDQRIER
jgi:Zn-dependent protease/CBS domain-containing protein